MAIFLNRDHVILAKTTCYVHKDLSMSKQCAFREISVLTRKGTNLRYAIALSAEHFSTIYRVKKALPNSKNENKQCCQKVQRFLLHIDLLQERGLKTWPDLFIF